jgi:hypothetical protein
MDSLDVRRLVPVDHRYGSLRYESWFPVWVRFTNASNLYYIMDVYMYPTHTDIRWWARTRTQTTIWHTGRSTTQIESEVACWLSGITQSTAYDGYLDNYPADPLV